MRNRGVDIVFDAIDTRGNAQLCKSMDGAGLKVQAKVSTVQNQNATIGTDFKDPPTCRNSIQVTGGSRNYEDVQNPAVADFRNAMAKYFPTGPARCRSGRWKAGRPHSGSPTRSLARAGQTSPGSASSSSSTGPKATTPTGC
ncbi:hypothetical protein ACU686_01905 [Yinghuangia aomiensis]